VFRMNCMLGRPSQLFLRILIALVCAVPVALGQQPQPPTPVPADSTSDKAKEG